LERGADVCVRRDLSLVGAAPHIRLPLGAGGRVRGVAADLALQCTTALES